MHTEAVIGGVIRHRCYERGCKAPAHRAGLCRFHYEHQQAREAETIAAGLDNGGRPLSKRCKVYVVLAENGLVKIGSAMNPAERLLGLQGQSPVRVKLTLLGAMIGTRDLERTIHRRLRRHCSHGEWYRNEGDAKRVIDAIVAKDAQGLENLLKEIHRLEMEAREAACAHLGM